MNRSSILSSLLVLFGVAVLISITVLLGFITNWRGADRSVLPDLKRSLLQVGALPGCTPLSVKEFQKNNFAFVEQKYAGRFDWITIQTHYDTELGRLGWKAQRTLDIREWGASYGGKTRLYCKPPYAAELHYVGTSPSDWQFSLSTEWEEGGAKPCLPR